MSSIADCLQFSVSIILLNKAAPYLLNDLWRRSDWHIAELINVTWAHFKDIVFRNNNKRGMVNPTIVFLIVCLFISCFKRKESRHSSCSHHYFADNVYKRVYPISNLSVDVPLQAECCWLLDEVYQITHLFVG